MMPSSSARLELRAAAVLMTAAWVVLAAGQGAARQEFRSTFPVDQATLVDHGQGSYFVLEPGYRLHLQHGRDTLVISVLEETRLVDGVRTRVVEERETEGGELAEVSRNFFAIDPATGDAYYFGEEVDEYRDGKVVGHEGAWLSGVNGAHFGLMMPGTPKVGDRYYTEVAPKVAMDRAEVVSVTTTLKVPAGAFDRCLRTRESSAIESGSEEKWYAPGIGLIRDAEFELARIEKGR